MVSGGPGIVTVSIDPSAADVLEPAVHRSIVCVDVEGFGARRRTRQDQGAIRHGLYQALELAFMRSGVDWDDCYREDRGDGVLILVAPQVPKAVLAAAVVGELTEAVQAYNQAHGPDARMRLRLALHGGEVAYDVHGVTGTAVNLAFRLLDVGQLKQALVRSPGVLAVISSGWFYDEVIRHTDACAPATWRRVHVAVKETREDGWISLPDAPYPADPDAVIFPVPTGAGARFSLPPDTAMFARAAAPPAPPRELPPDVPDFTGRRRELARLSAVLTTSASVRATTVSVMVISGSAGVGKTALAVHWAHHVRAEDPDAFRDGCLYLDMRGYDERQPVAAEDALSALLHSLGTRDSEIPVELAERSSRYRSVLDEKRMLIVLDNAHDAAQVRPLLPGTPSCAVLVTSRDDLAPLKVEFGVRILELDPLPIEDAVELVGQIFADSDTELDVNAAAALSQRCARLPLGLRIAAARAVVRRGAALESLVHELEDERRRLDVLVLGGDARTELRAVFSWSYRYLAVDAARMFRLMGTNPGPDLDLDAAAALTGTTAHAAQQLIDTLLQAHMIQPSASGRYTMHDLLRMYALERSSAEDPAESAAAAQRRLCDHYISGASVAMDALYPTEKARRPQVDTSSARLLLLGTQPSARAWLNSNMNNLLSAIADAAIHGRPEQAELLDATIASHLFSTGQFHNGMTAHSHAVNAARERGDRASEARALHNLANCLHRLGHLDEAFALLRQALELRWEVSDRKGEGHTLGLLGNVAWQAGRPEEAAQRFEEALAIAREVGDLLSESITLGNLGVVHDRLGDFRKALDYFEQSLAIARSSDDRSRVSYALANIGAVLGVLDRHADAVQHLTEALAIDRELGNRLHESSSLGNLGIAHLRLGKPVEALTYLEQSVIIDREIGDLASECTTTSALATAQAYLGDVEQALENHRRADQACDRLDQPNMKAEAYNYHGETLWVLGRSAEALKYHDAALVQALRIDSLYQQARAVEGAARALYSLGGRDAEALEQQQRALALYAQLGIPKEARSDRSS